MNKKVSILTIIFIIIYLIGINSFSSLNSKVKENLEVKTEENNNTLAIYIGDEIVDTMPSTNEYSAEIKCYNKDNEEITTSSSINWDGTKWVVTISGIDNGSTRCDIHFNPPAPSNWFSAKEGTLIAAMRSDSKNIITAPVTTPGRTTSQSSEAVFASAQDDYGYTYYYRGAVTNNYVVFAGMCWRIVRVDGQGNIKLTLYNSSSSSCTTTGNKLAFAKFNGTENEVSFNSEKEDNAYVGFMYGTPSSNTYSATHANTSPSTIFSALKTWYDRTFSAVQKEMLADVIWCNDISTTGSGYKTLETEYGPYTRLKTASTATPTLICPNDKDGGKLGKFTASNNTDGGYGNGALNGYKVGLLTSDEVAFAGAIYGAFQTNANYYLHENTGTYWWTMSPYRVKSKDANIATVRADGGLDDSDADLDKGLRPAISLKSNTEISSGNGTSSAPYIIDEK